MEENKQPATMQSSKKLEQLIIDENPEIFKGLNDDKKTKIVKAISLSMKSHSGPIPDSESLREYNDIIPDGANRIMIMAEKQADHRMTLEKKVISGQLFQSGMGQIFALVIGLFALGCGAYCVVHGYELGGGIIGAGGVVGLVTAFIQGKSAQKADLDKKRQQ